MWGQLRKFPWLPWALKFFSNTLSYTFLIKCKNKKRHSSFLFKWQASLIRSLFSQLQDTTYLRNDCIWNLIWTYSILCFHLIVKCTKRHPWDGIIAYSIFTYLFLLFYFYYLFIFLFCISILFSFFIIT